MGIILLHLAVMIWSKRTENTRVPYFFVFTVSLLIVLYTGVMMYTMEQPVP